MITERLMGVGRWDLQLSEDTPRSVMDQIDLRRNGFAHIVITAGYVDPATHTDAQMLSLSRYTGVYRKTPTEFGLSGPGVNMWVADEDGKGPVYASGVSGTSFASWYAVMKPSQLATGIQGTPAGTFTKTYPRTNLRKIVDEVSKYFSTEWRVTNSLKFDADVRANLFRTNPTAIIVRKAADGGRDLQITGIVGDLDLERDLEDWTRRVDYFTGSDASPTLTTFDGGVPAIDVPFRGPDGSAIIMDRLIDDFGGTSAGSASALAAAQFEQYRYPRAELTLSTDYYDIGQDISVGDTVGVFDPLRGIQDPANRVPFRGQWISPENVRCVGYTWPVRNGMGVYLRRYTKVGGVWVLGWVDLTEYVQFEDGTTSIEVGAKPRPSS